MSYQIQGLLEQEKESQLVVACPVESEDCPVETEDCPVEAVVEAELQ